ncbi:MAG: hypothetical protein RE471_07680 [Ferroplasma sp.]|uniref:hypothetical protein n=1 Tax=Ferroplasma sp. TaxID=2591003 RepID=UPI002814DE01|nr:hypothetical protein [Ferroplasma sp.]WMT50848.1 MAG: hypothetical protein RE471_07680 [Ferroplasma sp.]
MLIHENLGIIDTECVIELNIKSLMAENLKIIGKTFTVFIKKEPEGIFMQTFMDSSLKEKLMLNPDAFQSISGYLSYTEKFENPAILEFMESLVKIKTAMLHQPYLKDGKLYIPVSYRHTFSREISDAILPMTVIPGMVTDVEIHPVGGTLEILQRRNRERPVKVLRFSVSAGAHTDRNLISALEEVDSLGRVVNDYGSGDKFHIAVLTKKPLPLNVSIESIPGMEMAYWVNLESPLLGKLLRKANSRGIYLDINFIRIENGRIIFTQFVPKMMAMSYIQILYNTSLEEIKRNDVAVELVSDLSDYILQYI